MDGNNLASNFYLANTIILNLNILQLLTNRNGWKQKDKTQ